MMLAARLTSVKVIMDLAIKLGVFKSIKLESILQRRLIITTQQSMFRS